MTYDEYKRRVEFLRGVLKDALDRGDYHLEFDTKELLDNLEQTELED